MLLMLLKHLPLLIIGSFFLVQALFLTQPPTLVLDEAYYVKTARLINAGAPDNNLEHPTLGKQIIASSMKIFGDNPRGWRIPSFLLSTATLLLVFLIAKRFFGEKAAFFSTLLLALDPLWLGFSRLALLDIFAAFFAFLFFGLCFFYWRRPKGYVSLLAGLSLGASLAAKWVGLFLPIFFFLFLFGVHGGKLKKVAAHGSLFLAGALLVYLFAHFSFLKTLGWGNFLGVQALNFSIHTSAFNPYPGLKTLHPLFWLTLPILGFQKIFDEKGAVVLFFSPLSGWFFLYSFGHLIAKIKKNPVPENLKLIFLLSAPAFLYFPWFFVSRPKFLYHLLAFLPFIYLLVGVAGEDLLKRGGWERATFLIFIFLSFLTTLLLFPFTLGLPLTDPKAYLSVLLLILLIPTLIAGIFFPRKIIQQLTRAG